MRGMINILVIILISLCVITIAVSYTIADKVKPLQKVYCKIGWHCPSSKLIPMGFDGASYHCKCKWCGYEGMLDSQGNLF